MVLVAMRSASTWESPEQERLTARTILFTSTGSNEPFRFRQILALLGPGSGAATHVQPGTAGESRQTGVHRISDAHQESDEQPMDNEVFSVTPLRRFATPQAAV